jgi:hypothetical protein
MTEAAPTSTDATQVLAALLLPERDKYNARFALAQSRSRALQPREWKAVLNEDVAPLVFAAQQARADSAPLVAEAAYDEALRLLARNILGPRSNQSASALWRGVLAPCARAVAESPRRVLTRASNALAELRAHHLDGQWTQRAGELASRGLLAKLSAQDLERALFVLAWRCGLAHARGAALESLRALPFELASAIFGVENVSETEWATLRERMEREPFFDPSRGATGEERLEIVAQVGDWDAWGGAMAQPPRVARRKGALWAWSGRAWWRLHADAFGATLSPAAFRSRSIKSATTNPAARGKSRSTNSRRRPPKLNPALWNPRRTHFR